MVVAIPFALGALVAVAFAIYYILSLPPAGRYVTGPDGQRFQFSDKTTNQEIVGSLTREYGRPIKIGVGRDEVWPWNYRDQAWHSVGLSALAAVGFVLGGAIAYVVSWLLGWIIAGFRSD